METIEVLPIRVRVTAILRKALLSGEYSAGTELSLTDLSAELGVSRTPVREAFQSLAAEGLLELRMNRGAIVVGIDEKFIREHFDLRILLEGEAAFRAAEDGTALSELQVLQTDAESRSLSEREYRVYNQKFHTVLWRSADNQKIYDLLQSLWNGPSAAGTGRDTEHEACSIREHRQILTCLERKDGSAAREAMRSHLTRSMENIILSFQKTQQKENGKVPSDLTRKHNGLVEDSITMAGYAE